MATETNNLKLNKPNKTDFYSIDLVNANMDKIDEAIAGKADKKDIPTSLPANGGNADMLGGKSPDYFATKSNLFISNSDLFTYIESLTAEQLPTNATVTIRAYNCKNSPAEGYPIAVDYALNNGGDFIIEVTRLEKKDWYILFAKEVTTHRTFRCLKHNNVWQNWYSIGDVYVLLGGTDLLSSPYLSSLTDSWTIQTFRIENSPSAPINLGYSVSNNDFYYTIFKLDNTHMRVIGRDVRSNREFVRSKIANVWTDWVENVQTNPYGGTFVRREFTSDYEGGQLILEKAPKTTIDGDFGIDIYGDKLRVFGGSASKGAYLDISTCSSNLVDKLLTSKNVAVQSSSPSAPITGDLWIW